MSFEYDSERRLSKAYQTNAPGNVASYAYDAMNRLVSRSVAGGATVYYIHDIFNHIIAETDATGASLREYIWLGDMPVAVVSGANTAAPVVSYVHTDHLARPVRMTAQSGAIAWWAVYAPFGAVHATGGALQQDMRFPGQWFQMETGLAYNWNRHYDATLGRYVQPDPLGYGGGRSLYGYVGGNPLAMVDPEALSSWNAFRDYLSASWDHISRAPSDIVSDPLGSLQAGLEASPGLGTLASEMAAARAAAKAVGKACPPKSANPRSLQPRLTPDEMSGSAIKRLTNDMKANGFDPAKPIDVADVDGRMAILDGHHRAAAAVRAGIDEVPVIMHDVTPEFAAQLQAQIDAARAQGSIFGRR